MMIPDRSGDRDLLRFVHILSLCWFLLLFVLG